MYSTNRTVQGKGTLILVDALQMPFASLNYQKNITHGHLDFPIYKYDFAHVSVAIGHMMTPPVDSLYKGPVMEIVLFAQTKSLTVKFLVIQNAVALMWPHCHDEGTHMKCQFVIILGGHMGFMKHLLSTQLWILSNNVYIITIWSSFAIVKLWLFPNYFD